MKIALCIPVYDDWQAAQLLLARVDAVAAHLPHEFDVLFVDDASTEALPGGLGAQATRLGRISALLLRKNLGHQRAIAVGLAHLAEHGGHDAVLIMDADGEDSPDGIPTLVGRYLVTKGARVVFAQRARHRDGFGVRAGTPLFRLLYRWLVGKSIPGGSHSIVPRAALERLVHAPELWNHFAAAVQRSRLELDSAQVPASPRLAGTSRMSFAALVAHGLGAISVHAELAAARFLVSTALFALLSFAVAGLARFALCGVLPAGSACVAFELGLASTACALLGLLLGIAILRGRSGYELVPARDAASYVREEYEWPRALAQ